MSAADVLGAMITPAVLISASGTLVLSTSNRLTRVVDRARTLLAEVEAAPADATTPARQALISDQLTALARRALLLRSAMTALYAAIGLLVATSIAVGVVTLVPFRVGWVPVATGLIGACALLYGSLLLVREANLAIGSTLREMSYVRDTLAARDGGDAPAG